MQYNYVICSILQCSVFFSTLTTLVQFSAAPTQCPLPVPIPSPVSYTIPVPFRLNPRPALIPIPSRPVLTSSSPRNVHRPVPSRSVPARSRSSPRPVLTFHPGGQVPLEAQSGLVRQQLRVADQLRKEGVVQRRGRRRLRRLLGRISSLSTDASRQ